MNARQDGKNGASSVCEATVERKSPGFPWSEHNLFSRLSPILSSMRNAVHEFRNFRLRQFGRPLLRPRIAVLIDCDNVNQHGIRAAFAVLELNWNATVRRAYGRNLVNKAEVLRDLGIMPVEVVPTTRKKNITAACRSCRCPLLNIF
jgi:hypothetical protein